MTLLLSKYVAMSTIIQEYLPRMNQRSILHDTVVCVEGGGLEDARATNLMDTKTKTLNSPFIQKQK